MAIDLDELERLAAQITPLPWRVADKGYLYVTDANPNREIARLLMKPRAYNANAAYIVASCNSLPTLIAENRALRGRVRELERQRDWLAVFIEDNMDCDKCPYFLTVCTPEAPVDCAEWIKQAAKEAGE